MSDKKEKQEKQLRLDEKMTRGVARWSAAFGLSFQHILTSTGARAMPIAAGIVFVYNIVYILLKINGLLSIPTTGYLSGTYFAL